MRATDLPAPAAALERSGPDPLHQQIERALRAEIVAGRWAPHRRLPPEPELAASLGVNRGTLRRALAALITQGLLVPLRGRGTFVAPIASEPSIAQRFRSLSEDFTGQGFRFTRTVRSATIGRLPLPVRTVLGAPSAAQALRLERTFVADDGPLAYLVNYVRTDLAPGLDAVDFGRVALFDALSVTCGIAITEGRRTISAQGASAEVADALQVPAGAAVLYIEQVSFAEIDGSPVAVEYSDVWIDSNKVTISAVLARG